MNLFTHKSTRQAYKFTSRAPTLALAALQCISIKLSNTATHTETHTQRHNFAAGLYLSVTKKIYIFFTLIYMYVYTIYGLLPVARCQAGSCLPHIDFLFGQCLPTPTPTPSATTTPGAIPCLHLIIPAERGICYANGSLAKHIIIYHLKLVADLKSCSCSGASPVSCLRLTCLTSFILIVNCTPALGPFGFAASINRYRKSRVTSLA